MLTDSNRTVTVAMATSKAAASTTACRAIFIKSQWRRREVGRERDAQKSGKVFVTLEGKPRENFVSRCRHLPAMESLLKQRAWFSPRNGARSPGAIGNVFFLGLTLVEISRRHFHHGHQRSDEGDRRLGSWCYQGWWLLTTLRSLCISFKPRFLRVQKIAEILLELFFRVRGIQRRKQKDLPGFFSW